MRRWRGNSLIGVAGLHTAFTLMLAIHLGFANGIRPGFGSADPPELGALAFAWSTLFGVALGILGVLIRDLEHRDQPVSRLVGALLLGLCAVGAVLMPASGFWLAMPAALSLARHG